MRAFSRVVILSLVCVVAASFMGAGPSRAARNDVVIGMSVEPPGLDPTIAAPTNIRDLTHSSVFEGLVRISQEGKVEPLLARSWTISPDGLVYTFHLREGVVFHDGTPFDSSIVKYSLERAGAADSTNAQKKIFSPIASVETPSPMTVVVTLSRPSGNFLYYLSWGDAIMVAPNSSADNRSTPIGTGPFRFKLWQRGSKVELIRNERYWQAGLPRLDSVTFRFIADPQAQAAALNSGAVDAFPNVSAPELIEAWRTDPRFTVAIGDTEGEIVAGMNNAKAPFNNVLVRRALMHAVDRQAIIDGAYAGIGRPIGSHFSPNHPAFIDLTGVLPYDPAKARALLREAGYPNGFSLTIKSPQMPYALRPAELLVAFFADVGVQAKIEVTEFPAKWIEDVYRNKNYEMTIIAQAEPLDIDIYARDDYYFNYRNEKFKELIARIDRTVDETERNALYGEAQKILAEDVPALFLFQWPKLGVWNAKLRGFWVSPPVPANNIAELHWVD